MAGCAAMRRASGSSTSSLMARCSGRAPQVFDTERTKDDDLVQPVDELRPEMCFNRFDDQSITLLQRRFVAGSEADAPACGHVVAQVRRQDDNSVAQVRCASQ